MAAGLGHSHGARDETAWERPARLVERASSREPSTGEAHASGGRGSEHGKRSIMIPTKAGPAHKA